MLLYQRSHFCYSHGNMGSHKNIWTSDIYIWLPSLITVWVLIFFFILYVLNRHSSVTFIPGLPWWLLTTQTWVGLRCEGAQDTKSRGNAKSHKGRSFCLPPPCETGERRDHDRNTGRALNSGRRNPVQTNRNARWWQVPWREMRQGKWMRSRRPRQWRVVIVIV